MFATPHPSNSADFSVTAFHCQHHQNEPGNIFSVWSRNTLSWFSSDLHLLIFLVLFRSDLHLLIFFDLFPHSFVLLVLFLLTISRIVFIYPSRSSWCFIFLIINILKITIFKFIIISISSQHLGSNPDPGSHVVIVQTGVKSSFFW